jgi:AAHS family 4-hydroxybenzoate transporter-like MFS transporter
VTSEQRTLTVSDAIDARPLGSYQILTTVLCGVVLVLDGFNAQSIGFLAPPISETLHIPLKSFGPIFGAGLFGLMLASMAIGPIADRWGRKGAIVGSTLAFAVFTLMTPHAATFNQLLILRFFTGLGLGGAIPNAIALTVEYSPKRLVSTAVGVLMSGLPLGLVTGGLVASAIMPRWGWQSVLYSGGVLPLVLGVVLILWLPESVRFLSVRGGNEKKISRIMGRISPELASARIAPAASQGERAEGLPVADLFTDSRALATILLWIPFFMNLLTLYFIVSWLPALMHQSGMSVRAGVLAVSLFSVGGIIVSMAQGPLMNRFGAYRVLVAEFVLCALLTASFAFVANSFLLTVSVAFIVGGCVTGAQSGLNALAAHFYPTAIRSTGVGWALGVGRIGSIVGPVLAGAMLLIGWTPQQILLAAAIPAFCSAAAVMLSNRLQGSASAYRREPGPSHAEAAPQ